MYVHMYSTSSVVVLSRSNVSVLTTFWCLLPAPIDVWVGDQLCPCKAHYCTPVRSFHTPSLKFQLAKQIAFIQSQLSNVSPEDCAVVLQQTHGDTKRAITLLQVDMLMKMQFDYITPEDCHTALAHCQNKVDRAAEWLLEKSMTIVAKRV